MAELTQPPGRSIVGGHAWTQFRAIFWLRWRILANQWRRGSNLGETVGRLLLLPLVSCLLLLPAALAGFLAWYLAMHGSLEHLDLLLWATFVLTQLLNINLGQPGTTFDPLELTRFPIHLRDFIVIRLCFGLLSPANVAVALMSVAIFLGITIDRPALWPWTLTAMASFALANVLFTRMIFAWVDRWLFTRRAREIFTALIFAGSLGLQYINLKFNPGLQQHNARHFNRQNLQKAQVFFAHWHPWLRWLPPEQTSAAVNTAVQHNHIAALVSVTLVAGYAGLFLFIYAMRMRTEYRGENISDLANAVAVPRLLRAAPRVDRNVAAVEPTTTRPARLQLVPASLGPQLRKEFLLLRRNMGLLYGIIAPLVLMMLFVGRLSLRAGSSTALLLAVGYSLLGLAPTSYNAFGAEGTGAQFYFVSPVPLREVFLAKNLMHLLLALVEICFVLAAVTYLTGKAQTTTVVFILLWAMATLLLNVVVGNLRSLSAPKKVNPGRSLKRAQSQLSVWISLAIFGACAGLAFGFQSLAQMLHLPWLDLACAAGFLLVALLVYRQGLLTIENYAMDRRETLFEELGKKT